MFNHQYFSAQYFPPVWFAPGDESHLLPHETRGMSEFEVDFADDPKPRKLREAKIEPAWQKAIRLRNEARAENKGKQRKKAKQIEIRAAKTSLDFNKPDGEIDNDLLSMYFEWIQYQPVIVVNNNSAESDYVAFLSMIGKLIHKWQQDEEDAILSLIL